MIPNSIVIDGIRQGRCNLVIIDRQSIPLQPVGFRIFAVLGIQLLLGENDGWVQASVLYRPGEIVSRYIYRMKQSIYSAVPRFQSWRVVENDRQYRYRLIARPATIIIEPVGIRGFGDHELERMMDEGMAKVVATYIEDSPSYR